MIGTHLGPYEVTAKLGEGGMGEVYRARDSKLRRDVALKVLPAAFTEDPERLARFEREAQLLAQLHHPHIASIFGLEDSDGVRALVMELVDGPTLADRMTSGALSVEESVAIARQIAEALEEAHDKGIVHRDLKPQNVKAPVDGKVKVLDFGLAKAMDPVGTASGSPSASQLAASPTLTLGATAQGVILGTAAYMSPEQARGGAVDKRADIWAFGVVLYEMLTGRTMFAAETVSDTLAGVLRAEIDLDALPATTPPAIRRLLRRCLERSAKNRLHDIADARIVLDEVVRGVSDAAADAPGAEPAARPATWKRILPWATAALATVVAAVGWVAGRGAAGDAAPLFVEVGAPEGQRFQFLGDFGAPAVLSPDGTRIAFGAAGQDPVTRIWVRSLVDGTTQRLEATPGATAPFWSADGKSLGYFVGNKMMLVSLAGGSPYVIADAPNGRGGTWAPDGTIVFAPDFRSGLFKVPAGGGTPEPLTQVDPERHTSHRWPTMTPDGRAVVYLAIHHAGDKSEKESELRWIGLDGRDDHALFRALANGVVAGDELLYLRERTLLARRFDAAKGRLLGEPETLASDVLFDQSTWRGVFTAVGDRVLFSAGHKAEGTRISRADLSGRILEEIAPVGQFWEVQLSPDGRTLATTRGLPNDIWLLDLERGTMNRFTFDADTDEFAINWSPDGRWLYYAQTSGGGDDRVIRKAADGSSAAEIVFRSPDGRNLFPIGVTPDGRRLLLQIGVFPYSQESDLAWLDLDGSPRLTPLVSSPASEREGSISPDGRWVAYSSDESGLTQIYVVAADSSPGRTGPARWQVSVDGGKIPRWTRDGRRLIYLEPSLNLSQVEVAVTGDGLRFGAPQALFGTTLPPDQWSFDVAPDGQSLYLNHFGEAQSRPLQMIENWRRAIRR